MVRQEIVNINKIFERLLLHDLVNTNTFAKNCSIILILKHINANATNWLPI